MGMESGQYGATPALIGTLEPDALDKAVSRSSGLCLQVQGDLAAPDFAVRYRSDSCGRHG